MVIDIEDYLAEVIVDVSPVRIEALRDVLQRLEETIQVHLSVLAASHHIFINDIVMSLLYVVVRHVLELGQALELTRRYEVVILLARKILKYCLCVRVQIQFLVVLFLVGQDQLQSSHLSRSLILDVCFLLLTAGCCALMGVFTLPILLILFIKYRSC